MNNIYIRILVAVLIVALLIPVAGFSFLVAAFSGSDFYVWMVIIWALLLLSSLIVWVINKMRIKYIGITLAIAAVISIVSACGVGMYKSYIDSIPVVSEQEVNLHVYQPFAENTQAVYLDEPSTLQLTDSLPSIDGATALYPLYAAFVQATYPKEVDGEPVNFSLYNGKVRGGTTPQAYKRLIDGEVDLIFCARPSEEQRQAAERTGKQLHLTPIGREAFVFFVNAKNPISEITSGQIRDIYSGKTTNWSELGGENESIRPFQRPEGSGSQTMLEYIMGDTPIIEPLQEERIQGMGGIIHATARYKNYDNAIGYSFLFFATEMVRDNEIKLLTVDGVAPNVSTIADGSYPFTGDFYAITLGEPEGNVRRLIEWVLSRQGQEVVKRTGYVGGGGG